MKNKGFIRGALCGALSVLLVFSITACSSYVADTGKSDSAAKENKKNVSITKSTDAKLETLEKLVDTYYWGDADREELEEATYKGYIAGLGDPYSVYYTKEETEDLYETTTGEYSGIGAVLQENYETGIITLIQIYEDSPAEKAGLKADDILYMVDDIEVTGIDLNTVVTYIKGPKDTEVNLSVLRGKEDITVTAVRDTIEVKTVEHKMLEDHIGYIQVTEFDSVTFDQYADAMDDLEKQGMEGLVVDLRSNPGGSLSTVVAMLDLMLPEGTVVYTETKAGERTDYTSDEEHKFEKPFAVLVNGYSASASEIYAGAIQDFGTGKIVGTQSFGKGIVQQLFDLPDGTCVKLTISEYFTPNGRNIHGKGITPDVEVEYKADKKNPEKDNQLDKAVEAVKEQM
ncbi:MAG: S41 family peptidase [Dorea sp.]|nr:S41 family peptidase [Dorea sp.]